MWFYQICEVFIFHANSLNVITGIKVNVFVLRQSWVNNDLETEEITEGRHCANFAVGKSRCKLILRCQSHARGAKARPGRIYVNLETHREHAHHEFVVNFKHDDLGHVFPGEMLLRRDLLSGVGQGMRVNLVRISLLRRARS